MAKDFKLDILLEVVRAINRNMPDEKLYKLLGFALKNQLKISKAIIVRFTEGLPKVELNFGELDHNFDLKYTNEVKQIKDIQNLNEDSALTKFGFSYAVPVYVNSHLWAIILLGKSVESNNYNVDPVVKSLRYIQSLSNVVFTAMDNRQLLESRLENERVKRELELANQMQQMLIPKQISKFSDIEVSAYYKSHRAVGGDYYDILKIDKKSFYFCMADISGKGISAALLMSNLQAHFHVMVKQKMALQDIVTGLNKTIFQITEGDFFITIFIGKIDLEMGVLSTINAGHPAALLLRNNEVEELKKGCIPLGFMPDIPKLEIDTKPISTNDTLVVFTDGISEAFDNADNQFGELRIIEKLQKITADQSIRDFNLELLEEVQDFMGELDFQDDVALMSWKIVKEF